MANVKQGKKQWKLKSISKLEHVSLHLRELLYNHICTLTLYCLILFEFLMALSYPERIMISPAAFTYGLIGLSRNHRAHSNHPSYAMPSLNCPGYIETKSQGNRTMTTHNVKVSPDTIRDKATVSHMLQRTYYRHSTALYIYIRWHLQQGNDGVTAAQGHKMAATETNVLWDCHNK